MTQREKKERAQIKRKLQKDGVLPPDKPRLNRRKFAQEVFADWKREMTEDPIISGLYLYHAIGPIVDPATITIGPEEVGVLKVMKLAVEYKKFEKRLKDEGRTTYTAQEVYDEVIWPVLKL